MAAAGGAPAAGPPPGGGGASASRASGEGGAPGAALDDRDGHASGDAPLESPAEFTITRSHGGGAGYMAATLTPPAPHRPVLALGSIDVDGPAAQAGMRQAHVGWIITHVEGREVTAETGHAALDATRAPGRAFSIRVRRPATGELTVGPTAGGGLECRRQINHEDLRVQFLQEGDSRTTMTVELSPALVEMLSGGSSSQPEARAQVQAYMERLFEAMREQQSPRELEALAREEQEASAMDVVAADSSSCCAVCLEMGRVAVLMPCRHLATCHRCTVRVRHLGKCPICRARIEDLRFCDDLPGGEHVFRP